MAISQDLFLAILAMDSYNRGYNAGIGDAQNGLGGVGSQIGNATVTSQANSTDDQNASFYAQSYTWNGLTIVSYRGTDAPLDVANGWVTGTGVVEGALR